MLRLGGLTRAQFSALTRRKLSDPSYLYTKDSVPMVTSRRESNKWASTVVSVMGIPPDIV